MLLDANGRKIPARQMTANAVIFVSTDGDNWSPVKPYNVPKALKDPEAMGYLMAGEIIELADGDLYKAQKVAA